MRVGERLFPSRASLWTAAHRQSRYTELPRVELGNGMSMVINNGLEIACYKIVNFMLIFMLVSRNMTLYIFIISKYFYFCYRR